MNKLLLKLLQYIIFGFYLAKLNIFGAKIYAFHVKNT